MTDQTWMQSSRVRPKAVPATWMWRTSLAPTSLVPTSLARTPRPTRRRRRPSDEDRDSRRPRSSPASTTRSSTTSRPVRSSVSDGDLDGGRRRAVRRCGTTDGPPRRGLQPGPGGEHPGATNSDSDTDADSDGRSGVHPRWTRSVTVATASGSAAPIDGGAVPLGHPVKAWEDTKTFVAPDHAKYGGGRAARVVRRRARGSAGRLPSRSTDAWSRPLQVRIRQVRSPTLRIGQIQCLARPAVIVGALGPGFRAYRGCGRSEGTTRRRPGCRSVSRPRTGAPPGLARGRSGRPGREPRRLGRSR